MMNDPWGWHTPPLPWVQLYLSPIIKLLYAMIILVNKVPSNNAGFPVQLLEHGHWPSAQLTIRRSYSTIKNSTQAI